MRAALAAVICILLSVTAAAQDGLRSALLPERGPTSTVTPERDLFLVPPDFYNRRPDPGPARLFFPHPLSTFVTVPYPYLYPYFPQYDYARVPTNVDGRRDARPARRETTSGIPALPNVTLPASLPGPPKTFYVIPGCYAGDRPPEPDWLPAGCDAAKMRVIPPD